jgi:hypothetical protein
MVLMGALFCVNGSTCVHKTFVNITVLRYVTFKVFKYFEVRIKQMLSENQSIAFLYIRREL